MISIHVIRGRRGHFGRSSRTFRQIRVPLSSFPFSRCLRIKLVQTRSCLNLAAYPRISCTKTWCGISGFLVFPSHHNFSFPFPCLVLALPLHFHIFAHSVYVLSSIFDCSDLPVNDDCLTRLSSFRVSLTVESAQNGESISRDASLQSTLIVERGHQKTPVLSIPSGGNEGRKRRENGVIPLRRSRISSRVFSLVVGASNSAAQSLFLFPFFSSAKIRNSRTGKIRAFLEMFYDNLA